MRKNNQKTMKKTIKTIKTAIVSDLPFAN